jgi:hypothetical protein
LSRPQGYRSLPHEQLDSPKHPELDSRVFPCPLGRARDPKKGLQISEIASLAEAAHYEQRTENDRFLYE